MKPILLLTILISIACNSDEPNSEATAAPEPISTDSSTTRTVGQQKDIYGIVINENIIFLQQWDSTLNLEKILGTPIKSKTKQLDRNSDTFAGSFIRDLEFPGLKLKLFSPKQNGRTYWIQEIILTNSRYKTNNDISIGDDIEKVKQAYPSIKRFPGVNESMYQVSNEGYEKSIEMEFEKNKLIRLRMYYMMN